MDKKQQSLVIITVALVFLVILVYFVVLPKAQVYLKMGSELNDLRVKVNTVRGIADSLKAVKAKYDQTSLDLDKYGQLFDTEIQDGSNVILLGLNAATSKVQIMSIAPGEIAVKPNYRELPLNITAQGDYPNIINFCADIERLPNLSGITTFKIQGAQAGSSQSAASLDPNKSGTNAPNSYIQSLTNPGDVTITMSIIVYAAKTPLEKINLDEIRTWAIGRSNIFQPVSGGSALPEPVVLPQTVPMQSSNSASLPQAVSLWPTKPASTEQPVPLQQDKPPGPAK